MSKKTKQSKSTTPVKEKIGIVDTFLEKKGLTVFLVLLTLLSIWVFRDFIFLRKVYLFKDIGSDSINGLYPHLYHISEYWKHFGGIPKWTFYQGMGQNYMGYGIGDPFDWILLFTSTKNMIYLIGYIEVLKIITAGLFFYLYLKELNISRFTSLIGSLSFAFCGFMILGSGWHYFSSEVYQTAFLLFSIEKLLKNKWYYFPIAIAIIGISLSFNLFTYAIPIAVYIFIRCYNKYGISKQMLFFYSKVIGLALIGVGISSLFFINTVVLMLNSPRVSGDASFFSTLMNIPVFKLNNHSEFYAQFARLFSNDLLGTGSNYYGTSTGNYLEDPLFYFGLLNLLIFPQLLFISTFKRKIIWIGLLLVVSLPFVFPFFRFSFWFFAGKYYRGLSFLYSLLLLLYSIRAFDLIERGKKINFRVLLGTFISLIILLLALHSYQVVGKFRDDVYHFCIIFLIIYFSLLALLTYEKSHKYVKPLLLVFIVFELGYMSNITINKRPRISTVEVKEKVGFNDFTTNAVEYLHSKDSSFFRLSKEYASGPAVHTSFNDALIQNYYGSASYSSFNQLNYISFLQEVGMIPKNTESATRWVGGLSSQRPIIQVFGNVKYNLSKVPYTGQQAMLNDSISSIEDVIIYRCKYWLPLGYTYSKYLVRKDFDSLKFKDIYLLKAVTIDDSLLGKMKSLTQFHLKDTVKNYNLDELANDVKNLRSDSLQITKFSQNNIKGNISVSQDKLLFLTIPYDNGWKATDNGIPIHISKVNIGFSGIFLNKGKHLIELQYTPPMYRLSIILSIVFLILFVLMIIMSVYINPSEKKKEIHFPH